MAKNRGFVPARHLDGANCFHTERFLKATDQNDRSLIYVGDPVYLLADGTIARLHPAQVTAGLTGNLGVLGVAARVLVNEDGRPRVHGLTQVPAQHPNISLTADADYLDVYTDPGIVYNCGVDGSAGRSMIGQTVGIAATARTTAAGVGGTILDTAVVTAGSVFNPFKIIGMSDFELSGRAGNSDGNVQAIVNYHVYKAAQSF
ncbi:MAG: hypothetical protein ACREXR_01705 [Gammaproteobacteria bacterium]